LIDPGRASVEQLLAGYRAQAISPPEVIEHLARAIEARDSGLKAFTVTCLDGAADQARAAAARLTRGSARPLEGVPFVVKDLLDTAGVATACGSAVLAGRVPRSTAAPVTRLQSAGAILLGKTATHEFGWGITTTGEHRPPTRNPWAPDRVAGGSSGGSAVALAAELAPLALGTDTAGSLRIPGDWCGIVGHRPSRGLVPRDGAFPLAPSLDSVGPMARTPADTALALSVLSGGGGRGVTASGGLRGVRIGVSADLAPQSPSGARAAALTRIVELSGDLGARTVELPLPQLRRAPDALATIVLAEGLVSHTERELWPGRRDDYGADVRARLERGAAVTLDQYRSAMSVREAIVDTLAAAFGQVDLLLGPATAGPPPTVGADPADPAARRAAMACAAPQSLAGLPACTVRAGFDADGIPIAVQLTGRPGGDQELLAVATALYAATPEIQARRPPAARG
jgi:aspartyl-tRNA(Asn)/glutamyl-tRNA(Gln) amidotransferase subunit A